MASLSSSHRTHHDAPSVITTGGAARSIDAAALFATVREPLRRFCLRLTRDPDDADDLMQETFARFIARLPHLDPDVNHAAYLNATAHNLHIKGLRSTMREFADEFAADHAGADDDLERDPSRALLLGEQIEQVRRSAARLNGKQRRAIVLREVNGRSYAEIAADLGMSTDAVAQTISRARSRLRSEFRRELAPTTATAAAGCIALRDDLSPYLDGQLEADRRATVEMHLNACRDCRQVLEGYREAGVRLRAGAPLSAIGTLLERIASLVGGASSTAAGGAAVLGTAAVVTAGAGGVLTAQWASSDAHRQSARSAPRDGSAGPASSDRAVLGSTQAATTGSGDPGASSGAPSDQVVTPGGTTDETDPATPPPASADGAADPIEDPSGAGLPTPTVTAPTVTAPAVATPTVKTPKVSTPAITVPGVTTPKIETPVATVPSITTPPVPLPPVSVPDLPVPKVSDLPVTLPTAAPGGDTAPKLPKLGL